MAQNGAWKLPDSYTVSRPLVHIGLVTVSLQVPLGWRAELRMPFSPGKLQQRHLTLHTRGRDRLLPATHFEAYGAHVDPPSHKVLKVSIYRPHSVYMLLQHEF